MSARPLSLRSNDRGARVRGGLFHALLVFSVSIGFVLLGSAPRGRPSARDLPYVDTVLLTDPPSSDPDQAGARPGDPRDDLHDGASCS